MLITVFLRSICAVVRSVYLLGLAAFAVERFIFGRSRQICPDLQSCTLLKLIHAAYIVLLLDLLSNHAGIGSVLYLWLVVHTLVLTFLRDSCSVCVIAIWRCNECPLSNG